MPWAVNRDVKVTGIRQPQGVRTVCSSLAGSVAIGFMFASRVNGAEPGAAGAIPDRGDLPPMEMVQMKCQALPLSRRGRRHALVQADAQRPAGRDADRQPPACAEDFQSALLALRRTLREIPGSAGERALAEADE